MEKVLRPMENGLRYHLRKHMTRPANMRWHNSRNRPFLNNFIGFRGSGDSNWSGKTSDLDLSGARTNQNRAENRRDGGIFNIWQITHFFASNFDFCILNQYFKSRTTLLSTKLVRVLLLFRFPLRMVGFSDLKSCYHFSSPCVSQITRPKSVKIGA